MNCFKCQNCKKMLFGADNPLVMVTDPRNTDYIAVSCPNPICTNICARICHEEVIKKEEEQKKKDEQEKNQKKCNNKKCNMEAMEDDDYCFNCYKGINDIEDEIECLKDIIKRLKIICKDNYGYVD